MPQNRTPDIHIRRIQFLIKKNMSNRQIEEWTGISRGVVSKIRNGTMRAKGQIPEKTKRQHLKKAVYCEGCERMIFIIPCVACDARQKAKNKKLASFKAGSPMQFMPLPSEELPLSPLSGNFATLHQ